MFHPKDTYFQHPSHYTNTRWCELQVASEIRDCKGAPVAWLRQHKASCINCILNDWTADVDHTRAPDYKANPHSVESLLQSWIKRQVRSGPGACRGEDDGTYGRGLATHRGADSLVLTTRGPARTRVASRV